jgi:hypothetical protein
MEEKWLAFVEGNRLFVHRSWTGHGIYEATFSESGAEWHITSAVVEDDRTRHQRVSDVGEILRLELLIESVSLGCHRRDAWTAWYEAYAHDPTRVSGRGSGWPCTCG